MNGINKRSYSDEQIEEAVKTSESIAGVLRKLGLRDLGGNYRTIKEHINRLGLDTSHFTGQLWNKGKTKDKNNINSPTSSLEDIFANKVNRNTLIKYISDLNV